MKPVSKIALGILVMAFIATVSPFDASADYMAKADFSRCPRKYLPHTSAQEGPFPTLSQCNAYVAQASRGNNLSCARYSCDVVGGGASTGSSGSGLDGSLQQQSVSNFVEGAMSGNSQQMGLGLLGMGLGAMMQGGDEASTRERQQRQQELEAARQREAMERAKIEAEQARVAQERHQKLMGSLKGQLGASFDGRPSSLGTTTLQLKSGTALFGIPPSNPTGTLLLDDTGGAVTAGELMAKLPEAPPTPLGRSVNQATEKAWEGYLAALKQKSQADTRLKQMEDEHRMIEKLRAEAEKKTQEQKARVTVIPPDQPEQRKIEDDKLAEAEKLFLEAIKLEEDATKNLVAAKKDADDAQSALAESEKEKQQAMKAENE